MKSLLETARKIKTDTLLTGAIGNKRAASVKLLHNQYITGRDSQLSIMGLNKIGMPALAVSNIPNDMLTTDTEVLKFLAIHVRLAGENLLASGEILERIMSMQLNCHY